jgi:hypothetical protein
MRLVVALAVLVPVVARAEPRTVAHEVLGREGRYLKTTASMGALLDDLLADARAAVRALEPDDLDEHQRARATLAAIEGTLARHHFVYPARGFVDTLHEGLAAVTVDAAGQQRLSAASENASRREMIKSTTTFHIADCNIYSLLYVAIGQELGLPIRMVSLPSTSVYISYAYVAWVYRDGTWLAWEATEGTARNTGLDDYNLPAREARWNDAQQLYARPMTLDEVRAAGHRLAAEAAEKIGAYADATAEIRAALDLAPRSPEALNGLAWLLATTPDPEVRDPAAAIGFGERVVKLWPTPSHLDTLAAAHAAAGHWKLARATQQSALDAMAADDPKRPAFARRRLRYERCQVYVTPRAEERNGEDWHGALQDDRWGSLQVRPASKPDDDEGLPDRCPR